MDCTECKLFVKLKYSTPSVSTPTYYYAKKFPKGYTGILTEKARKLTDDQLVRS